MGEMAGISISGLFHLKGNDCTGMNNHNITGGGNGMKVYQIKDVTTALNRITGGRLSEDWNHAYSGENPYIVMKSSNLPGKAVMETPGLVYGHPDKPLEKLAVVMTLTEQVIELAAETGVDAIVTHHPVADAASSGGVLLKTYLDLYGLSVFELHEAFHGLHPGMAYMHGHAPFLTVTACGGVPGRIYHIGKPVCDVHTLGDLLDRIDEFIGGQDEAQLLEMEKNYRGIKAIYETTVAVRGQILLGGREDPVGTILHIFPHTGFDVADLEQVYQEYPEITTVLASVSRVRSDHPLVTRSAELGLAFLLGSSHAVEIFENGVPLGKALAKLLPGVEVVIFRQKVYSYPLHEIGKAALQAYGTKMCSEYLLNEEQGSATKQEDGREI
jgi:putative NIF3 family GTP cyclohydrolase 1 type 2